MQQQPYDSKQHHQQYLLYPSYNYRRLGVGMNSSFRRLERNHSSSRSYNLGDTIFNNTTDYTTNNNQEESSKNTTYDDADLLNIASINNNISSSSNKNVENDEHINNNNSNMSNNNNNMNMNINGIYYFKVYTELLYYWREDVTTRKKTILGDVLLALSVMRSPGSSCY